MSITQEQFNNIIDLLGNALSARALLLAHIRTRHLSESVKQASENAYEQYIQAVSDLYTSQPQSAENQLQVDSLQVYKTVYKERSIYAQGHTLISDGLIKQHEMILLTVNIGKIKQQMNADFCNGNDSQHFNYTGLYECKLVDGKELLFNLPVDFISVETSSPTALQNNHFPTPFLLKLMAHAATPIVGNVICLAAIGLIASGALGIGITTCVVGAALIGCYAASSLFFHHANVDYKYKEQLNLDVYQPVPS